MVQVPRGRRAILSVTIKPDMMPKRRPDKCAGHRTDTDTPKGVCPVLSGCADTGHFRTKPDKCPILSISVRLSGSLKTVDRSRFPRIGASVAEKEICHRQRNMQTSFPAKEVGVHGE